MYECDTGYMGVDGMCVRYVPRFEREPGNCDTPCGMGGQPICEGDCMNGATSACLQPQMPASHHILAVLKQLQLQDVFRAVLEIVLWPHACCENYGQFNSSSCENLPYRVRVQVVTCEALCRPKVPV